MLKRALLVATVGRFFGFERNDITILQSMGYEVHCAANFILSESDDFQADGVVKHPICFARIPWSKRNVKAYFELKKILSEIRFDLVHCHTPVGGALTRLVARKYRKEDMKVYYTAHGFHFFNGAPLKNWLLYFPAEWLCAHWTDVLITINKEDYSRAKRYMKAKTVVYIPGVGVDIEKFNSIDLEKEKKARLRLSLGIGVNDKVLISVGELNKNKNHEVVIRALSLMDGENVHYMIAGEGELREYLMMLGSNKVFYSPYH